MKRTTSRGINIVSTMEENNSRESNEEQIKTGSCLILTQTTELRQPAPKKIILDKSCIRIGRSFDVDHCILSKSISRIHCEIKQCCAKNGLEDGWTITDKSSNGVLINGTRIPPNKDHKLQDGDLIEMSSDTLHVPIVTYAFKAETSMEPKSLTRKRLKLVQSRPTNALQEKAEVAVPIQEDNQAEVAVPIQEDNQAVARLELQKKNEDLQGELHKMKEIMKQSEINLRNQWELEQESKQREEQLKLEKCRKEIEESKEEEWAQKLQDLNNRHKTALEEKSALSTMLRDMNENKSKEALIENEKARLESELRMKDNECSTLQQKLDEVTARNLATEEKVVQLRDDVIKGVSKTMEDDLQCSICSEMFVKAVILDCTHSYCSYCINEWKKKKADCPICRKPIASITPVLTMDNLIDNLVEKLDTTLKDRRKELVEERKKLSIQNIANPEIRIQVQLNPPAAARRGTRGRGTTRGRRDAVNILPRQPIAGLLQTANTEPGVYRVLGTHNTAVLNAGIRAVLPVPGVYRFGSGQGGRGHIVQWITNRGPPPQLQVNQAPPQQRVGAAVLPPNRMPFPVPTTATMQPPNRLPLPVPTTATVQPPNRAPLPAGMPPPNRQPSPPVNPIEISSESSEESEGDVGYFPGYGHCLRCGSNDHWANGCPF